MLTRPEPVRARILTWNVARRTSRLPEQAATLAAREVDLLAIQEVTERTLPLWRAACTDLGLGNTICSLDGADPRRGPPSRRRTGVLIASRTPLALSAPLVVPWPETAAAATAETPAGAIEVHAVHVPNAANGWVKPRTLQAIRAGLARLDPAPRVLCGDLNIPRREVSEDEVISFARDSRGRLRPERGQEWDEAELGVVPGLRDLSFRDAFRTLHGYRDRSPSWTWRQIAGHGGGWRIDHVFCSRELRPVSCLYHHGWRDEGLSDHAPLEAQLERAF